MADRILLGMGRIGARGGRGGGRLAWLRHLHNQHPPSLSRSPASNVRRFRLPASGQTKKDGWGLTRERRQCREENGRMSRGRRRGRRSRGGRPPRGIRRSLKVVFPYPQLSSLTK